MSAYGLVGAKPTPKPVGEPVLTHDQTQEYIATWDNILNALLAVELPITVQDLGNVIQVLNKAKGELYNLKGKANGNLTRIAKQELAEVMSGDSNDIH